jgi:hypothetical protein
LLSDNRYDITPKSPTAASSSANAKVSRANVEATARWR